MPRITEETSLVELAAIVSGALTAAGITAVLSGGGAVSTYTENKYESVDLDFVTAAGLKEIGQALSPLGFTRGTAGRARYFEHPRCNWYVEFPPAPLAVGSQQIRDGEWAQLETPYGVVQILSPTQSIMDRLAAYFWWDDQQSFDQAVMIADHQEVVWEDLEEWADHESPPEGKFERFKERARRA
jgi:hypothetical protein